MLTLKVHEYTRVSGSQAVRLTKVTPYIRLVSGQGPPIFIQNGKLWSEGGPPITDIPNWFYDEIRKVSKEALADVKYVVKGEIPAIEDFKHVEHPKKRRGRKPKPRIEQEITDGND
jgi:hypothetical protein